MYKELPITHLPIETYQGSAFVLGIIRSHDNVNNEYYNNYINLECNDTDCIFDVELEFTNALWEYYREHGIAEMNMYYINNIAPSKFVDFVKERIDQDNYIIFYSVDEYYLSYSKYYQKIHYIHDTYVYGYDEGNFKVLAYKNRKLSRLRVPYLEVMEAVYSQLEEQAEINSFCTFRPCHSIKVKIEMNKIKKEYCNYFNSVPSGSDVSEKVYGVKIYDVLIRCINTMKNDEDYTMKLIDLRPFRCLWEHKKVMKERIETIAKKGYIVLEEVERMAYLVFMFTIKYNITHHRELLIRITKYLDTMKNIEMNDLYVFINDLLCG